MIIIEQIQMSCYTTRVAFSIEINNLVMNIWTTYHSIVEYGNLEQMPNVIIDSIQEFYLSIWII